MSLYLDKSSIHGSGIFTTTFIKKGEKFYYLPLNTIYNQAMPRYAYIGKNRWVCDTKVLNWVNHSCQASAKLVTNVDNPYLQAMIDIQPGTEITCNYNITETGGVKVPCACQASKCKKYFLRKE